jgi:hypothetical protein
MNTPKNTNGRLLSSTALFAHLIGAYIGFAVCLTFLEWRLIVSGAVFTTIHLIAYHFRCANAEVRHGAKDADLD